MTLRISPRFLLNGVLDGLYGLDLGWFYKAAGVDDHHVCPSGSDAMSWPDWAISASIRSLSTVFLGQPRATNPTVVVFFLFSGS